MPRVWEPSVHLPPSAEAPQQPEVSQEVTVLSLDALEAADEANTHDLGPLLDEAFRGINCLGIVCITGGKKFQEKVREIREQLLPLALSLERSPEADKQAIQEQSNWNRSHHSHWVDGSRSGLCFQPTSDRPEGALPADVGPDPAFYTPNRWPGASSPDFRTRAREAERFLVSVGRKLARALDRRCSARFPGYQAGTLSQLVAEPESCNHQCRLICYHEYWSDEQLAEQRGMWAPPHKDTGLLTALVPGVFLDPASGRRLPACPDPAVGLYVKTGRGKIVQVSAPAGVGECLFFKVGEAMLVVSGGLYLATEHCVRGPPRPLAGYMRASLAVVLQPHAHEELPLPEGVSLRDVAYKVSHWLFRRFLLQQPADSRGIKYSVFCQRDWL